MSKVDVQDEMVERKKVILVSLLLYLMHHETR
jgi:hypothetical protein